MTGGSLQTAIDHAYNRGNSFESASNCLKTPHLGREDERQKLDQMVNAVAAQSYDNIYNQLKDLQLNKLKESSELAEQLKHKLHPPVELRSYCNQVVHPPYLYDLTTARRSLRCWIAFGTILRLSAPTA